MFHHDDPVQFMKEPFVYICQLVNVIHRVTVMKSLENTSSYISTIQYTKLTIIAPMRL